MAAAASPRGGCARGGVLPSAAIKVAFEIVEFHRL
jgi:hypothetical protein